MTQSYGDNSAWHEATDEHTARESVRAQLRRILESPEFNASARRKAFLTFIVEESLAGRANRIKGFTIGVAVFGREAETFDPQTDPVVRLEAGRLRRDLERYYLTAGQDDEILVTVPKGAYIPVFTNRAPPAEAKRARTAFSPAWLRPTRRARLAAGCGVAAVLALGVALPAWYLSDSVAGPPSYGARGLSDPDLALPRGASVAVIPFSNLSGDPAQSYFADGIYEQIVTDLTRFKGMYVLSPASTQQYRNATLNPRALKADLGVDYFLAGGVRRVDNRVRITVRLVETQNGRVIWAEAFDRELAPDKILEVQAEISRHVAANIGSGHGAIARSTLASAAQKPATSLDSYECVLHYYHYDVTGLAERHAELRDCLEQVVTLDPGYAEAWARLGTIYADEHRFGFNARPELYAPQEKALEAAKRAVALSGNSATARQTLADAYFNMHDLEGFRREGERSLALNPNDPDLISSYGMRLAFIGEWDRGLALMRRAMAMNPNHPGWYRFPFVLYHYERGQYAKALAQIRLINMPDFYWTHLTAAMTLAQLGREDEAQASLATLMHLKPDFGGTLHETFRAWNLPAPLVERIMEGLRKAGLETAQRAAARS